MSAICHRCRRSVRKTVDFLSLLAFSDGLGEHIKHLVSVLEIDTGVRDTDAVLQTSFAFGRNFLVS